MKILVILMCLIGLSGCASINYDYSIEVDMLSYRDDCLCTYVLQTENDFGYEHISSIENRVSLNYTVTEKRGQPYLDFAYVDYVDGDYKIVGRDAVLGEWGEPIRLTFVDKKQGIYLAKVIIERF
ncbi:hypothetical protein [Thaumasiovibrio subtropicus]|uniref:hypothetical protein n=1 Tax=Thaumasiovibrio subtropicus TaxID=1891207 RepID=UPI000B3560E3|nr:hypothetical protein [Thaumasiovibrio subtropicus]